MSATPSMSVLFIYLLVHQSPLTLEIPPAFVILNSADTLTPSGLYTVLEFTAVMFSTYTWPAP